MEDTFWDDCPLVERVPGKVSGTPVLKGPRLPADTLVEAVEAFMELEGMTEDQAIEATLECFPGTAGGENTVRSLLAYEAAHLRQVQS